MTELRPRKVAHKGRVEAAGFLFNADLIGVAEMRRRILDLWEPGVEVFTDGPNHFVRLSSSVRVNCANSVATPLVQIDRVLSALPLSQDEFELLQAPSHSVVFASSGVAHVMQLSPTAADAPEKWLDVTVFKVVDATSLGAAFAEPKVVNEPEPFDARTKLDGVPGEAAQRQEVIAAIKSAAFGTDKQSRNWRSLFDLFNWGARVNRNCPGPTQRTDKGNDWFTRLGMRLLYASRLSRVVGRRQAAYLTKMMDMFERGDLTEALKHAIPLGDFSSLNQRPALRVPSPRSTLSIRPWQGHSSRSIGLGGDLMNYLNQLYRASYERLVAQGRIEEAAFVLAELLRANEEAVAFLERHGKLRLAAELAEARELPPGLIVRQWFVAGEIDRAVAIARRTQSFADAVWRLEKRDKEQGEKLRIIWAASLAQAGNYAGAVDAIWSVESVRRTALEWIDRAIDVGGPLAARMLARKLVIIPEDFADIRRRAFAFLEDESFEQQETRMSFAEALINGENTAETQTLARVAARAVLRDAGQTTLGLTAKQFSRLVSFCDDGPLRTDVPTFLLNRDQPFEKLFSLACASEDRGSVPVLDLVMLPNGRMLVALGELGVRLLSRDGRTVTHFDQPADKLVISDNGNRAIALARRGEVWRLSRLDLVAWHGEDWCDAHIDAFAPNYDGSLWFLGAKGDFYAIDAHAKNFDALWRVPDAGEKVFSVARSETSCGFLTGSNASSELEQWLYHLPLLVLRRRTPAPVRPDNIVCMKRCDALSPRGVYVNQSLYCELDANEPDAMQLTPLPLKLRVFEFEQEKFELAIGDGSCEPLLPEISGSRIVSPVWARDVLEVRVIDIGSQNVTAQLSLAGATQVATRLTEKTLTVADDLGRVIAVDLQRNCAIRNLRI